MTATNTKFYIDAQGNLVHGEAPVAKYGAYANDASGMLTQDWSGMTRVGEGNSDPNAEINGGWIPEANSNELFVFSFNLP